MASLLWSVSDLLVGPLTHLHYDKITSMQSNDTVLIFRIAHMGLKRWQKISGHDEGSKSTISGPTGATVRG